MTNGQAGLPSINVGIRVGIIDTIAKSIYADPKVKIREAVANSMDNGASWFMMFVDPASRSICLLDNGNGITRSRFDFIFDNIGYGEGRKGTGSNSYFGLGLMSILQLGEKADIITKAKGGEEVLRLEADSKKIFSPAVQSEPISNVKQWLKLTVVDLEVRERVSVIPSNKIEETIGSFPDSFTEILLTGIEAEVFQTIASEEFESDLRKVLPLKPHPDESFLLSIRDFKSAEWLKMIMGDNQFCPTIDVYFGISEKKDMRQIWKYYPDFRKELRFEGSDINYQVISYKDSQGHDREFAFYYLTSIGDLEGPSKDNIETGIWVRNRNFLVKEADYLQEPGTRQSTLHEPLKNWLFGEIFHKGMTDFLVVTRNEYNWRSKDFQIFREAILSRLRPLNAELRKAWKINKSITDLVIAPFQEMAGEDNPLRRCYGTLENMGIISGPQQAGELLDKMGMLRKSELEDESKRIDRLIGLSREEIVLVDDEQVRVVVDPGVSNEQGFVRHREEGTKRIVARLSPSLFSTSKVKFLENTFDVFFVAAKDSAPGVSIDPKRRKIFINPFNQDISKYSLSFVEVYIAAELASALSNNKDEMKDVLLRLLGNKLWRQSESPKRYLRALSDELERRLAGI